MFILFGEHDAQQALGADAVIQRTVSCSLGGGVAQGQRYVLK
jgi:hypothetical protein